MDWWITFDQQAADYLPDLRIEKEEPMDRHTSFRIGGPAEAYVCPGNEDELGKVICMCREHDIPWSVLGNGSNLLVSDRGIKGVVIAMEGNWCYAGGSGVYRSQQHISHPQQYQEHPDSERYQCHHSSGYDLCHHFRKH